MSTLPDDAARIVEAVSDRSARGLATAVGRLIRSGDLPAGSRLPTVRVLARALGVSPTTVGGAWRSLAQVGVIETRGRNGSFVNGASAAGQPARFWRLAGGAGHFARDLSAGIPDPALLPPLGPALAHVDGQPPLSGYLDSPVLPTLENLVREAWSASGTGEPEAMTIIDGSLDGVDRVLASLVHFGDRVAVENPTFPPFLDLLDVLGAVPVPVAADDEGVLPDALDAALTGTGARVALLQPRAHNPTGASMSPGRARAVADVVARSPDAVVIEDDHSGAVAVAAPVSVMAHLPDRTVMIQSFSKSHGPDLRLAALGGPADIVEPLVARRHLGASWSSRFLQQLLVGMLTDPACVAAVERARTVYAERRSALLDALAARGVTASGRDGINLWVDVDDERDALVALAAQGIGVAPGSAFMVATGAADPASAGGVGDHIRITTSVLPVEDVDTVADAVADAARPRARRHVR
jgi:DNA-binding transcriptional MocR family regulator